VATLALAGEPLSLKEAVRQALGAHASLDGATARTEAAQAGVEQARAGLLPRVQYKEGFQSGNNPVYVFSSLLTQHQFAAANFDIHRLNRPDVTNNFQSTLGAEQLIYDFGGTRAGIRAAELGKRMTEAERKVLEQSLIARVARSYYGVTLAGQALDVAREALKTAEADEHRAETVRDAGMATEADVLSVRVHVSAMKEQVIRREADLKVARAALNEALGLPLDTEHSLTTDLRPAGRVEASDAKARPELEQLRLARQMAGERERSARAGLWPKIGVRGAMEVDRNEFASKGGANWMFMAGLEWNLFDGNHSRAAAAQARALGREAAAAERQASSGLKLELLKARAEFDAASERIAASEAVVAQAEESLRILRNRYSNGLATVTDLLRAQTALLDVKTRRLAAVHDQRLAAVEVERAAGILTGVSNVLD
jgi:outer membrane protein TolC